MIADFGPPTTAGIIALANLEARIEGWVWQATRGELTVGERFEFVELTALRGHVLGCIADQEHATAHAEELVGQAANDPRAFVVRARMAAVFHRFSSALTDLNTASALGGDPAMVDAERAAVYQALGRYDEAFAVRERAVETRADFSALGAMAGLYAERGEVVEADRWFSKAIHSYSGLSPFPLAVLEFQCGKLWMDQGEILRASDLFAAAIRRIPAYVPAQGHLAEVESARGNVVAAIASLRRLAAASDDPDYATQLARILNDQGHTEEAQAWRAKAAARYDELLARHVEAFADHAAEFWLTVGDDPDRAMRLALQNLAVRQTPQAYALLERASAARARRNGPRSPRT